MAFCFLRRLQRSTQLRPACKRIAALARLDLSELGQDLKGLGLRECHYGAALRLEAKATPALLHSGDAVVGDQLRAHDELGETSEPASACPNRAECQASCAISICGTSTSCTWLVF